MFDNLLNWLNSTLLGTLRHACSFFAKMFNPLIGITISLYEMIQAGARAMTGAEFSLGNVRAVYNQVLLLVGDSVFGLFPLPIQALMAFVNYMFPVTECLIMVALLSSFYCLAVTLRLLKSFIPGAFHTG